jgi:hypothetical protein
MTEWALSGCGGGAGSSGVGLDSSALVGTGGSSACSGA